MTTSGRLAAAILAVAALAACGGQSPEEQLADAQRAYAEGDLRTASVTVRSLLQDAPDNAEARLLLGRIALDAGDIETAEAELDRARQLGAGDADLSVAMAEVLLRQNQATEAQVMLAGIPANNRPPRAALLDVDALLLLEDYTAASAAVDALLEARPGDAEVLTRQAWLQIGQGEYADALATATRARELAPNLLDAARVAGEASRRLGDFSGAGDAFVRAAELARESGRPKDAIASWYAAAVSYVGARDFDAATRAVDGYEVLVGDDPATSYLRASLAFEQRDYATADRLLQETVLTAPDDANVLRLYGATKLALGELGEARRNLRAALARNPADAAASQLLAQVYLRQGQPDAALELLRDQDLTSSANVAVLAQTLLSVDRADEAIALLEQAEAAGGATRQTRLLLARGYAMRGDDAAVESTLREAIAGDEQDYTAVLQLMRSYLTSGEPERARELTESLLAERPDDYRAHATAVLFLQVSGETDLALQRAETAAARFPDNVRAQLLLGSASAAAERLPQAETAFKAALDVEPDNIDAMIGLAQIYERTERRTAMIDILERAANATERDPRPTLVLGRIYLKARDFVAAQQWLERAIAIAPSRAEPHALLGAALMAQNQPASARQSFEQAVVQPDATQEHFVALARLRARDGSSGAAARALDDGIERFPDSAALKAERARLALANRELDAAAELVDAALSDDPENLKALLVGGETAAAQREWGTARQRLAKALENGAGDAVVVALARVSDGSGEGDAVAVLEGGLQQFPESVLIRQDLAQRALLDGDAGRATSLYREALDVQPENALVLNNLAWLLHEAGDAQALALAERAVALAPNAAPVLDTYGVILMGEGRDAEALEALQRAMEGAPDNAEIRYHLAQAQAATGDAAAARASLRTVLEAIDSGPVAEQARALLESLE